MNSQLYSSIRSTAHAVLTNNAAKYHVAFGTALVAGVMLYEKRAARYYEEKAANRPVPPRSCLPEKIEL